MALFQHLKIGEIRHFHRIMVINKEYCYLSGMKRIKDNKNRVLYYHFFQ